jgi:hypothetical protein
MTFERIAVTPGQIAEWHLPSRPTKKSDTRAAAFGDDDSVELDAVDPRMLRVSLRWPSKITCPKTSMRS